MINLEKEIREQPQTLAAVPAANTETVKRIVSLMKEKKIAAIAFSARGTSDHAEIYAQYLFHRYTGIPCSLATPSCVTLYGAHMHYEHTLVIGISQSGRAEDVLAVISDAKSCGGVTVAVTNNNASPLAKAADFHLDCTAGAENSIAATKTFTAQMYLLAMLCAEYSQNEELQDILVRIPSLSAELLKRVPSQVEAVISRYRYLEDAFVLGRGMAYPIALEGALKVLETNKIRVRGYASSDFQHGPMAQISPRTLAIILAPRGEAFDDAVAIEAKIAAQGAETLFITDDVKAAAGYARAIVIPSAGCDAAAPFFLAMTMQLFALKLTEIKGIDPDQSEVLKKITITK